MATTISILVKLISLTFVFGQLARLSLLGFSFPLVDPLIIFLTISTTINQRRSLNFHHPWWKFIAYSWVILLLQLAINRFPIFPSALYLLRFTCLLILLINPPKIPAKNHRFLDLCLISSLIFGLIQYLLWPNLTYFDSFDWDPHLNRLVGSLLDPTFTAIIFLLFLLRLCLSTSKSAFSYLLITTTYIALSLTYSRSTFLSLSTASIFLSFYFRQIRIFFLTTTLILLTLVILPQKEGEGSRLNRTSTITAKIENYHQGINLFSQSPILGLGYNTIGFHRPQISPTSHAKWGLDGSLLNIAIGNGVIGLYFFLSGLLFYFKQSSLLAKTMLLSLLVHSLFANSLLFPWPLLYFSLVKYRK